VLIVARTDKEFAARSKVTETQDVVTSYEEFEARKQKAQAASFLEQARFCRSRAVGRTHVQPPN